MHKSLMMLVATVFLFCDTVNAEPKPPQTEQPQTEPDKIVEQELDELREVLDDELDVHLDETASGRRVRIRSAGSNEQKRLAYEEEMERELDRLMDKPDGVKIARIRALLDEREQLILEIELARSSDCRRLLAIHENLERDHEAIMKEIKTLMPTFDKTNTAQIAEFQRLIRLKDIFVNENARIIEDVHLVTNHIKTNISRVREIEKEIADLVLPGKRLPEPAKPTAPQELKAPDWKDPSSIPKMFGECFQENP